MECDDMKRKYDELLSNRIFIGGADDALEVIESGKADIVFDVRAKGHDQAPDYPYVHATITDEATAESIAAGAKVIKEAYEQGKNIYIHCGSGGGRAGVMSAAVLQEIGEATSLQDAISKVKTARPIVEIRPNMQAALDELYK